MPRRSNINIYFLIAISLLIYTTLRAVLLSVTCDEGSTFFTHVQSRPVWICFFSEDCWGDANNHLLNTFLIQIAVKIFGTSELTLRLPNLLAHFCFLYFSIGLVREIGARLPKIAGDNQSSADSPFRGLGGKFFFSIKTKSWLIFAGFCLLNLAPYFLEFFSLARGYGLGAGLMMMSLFYFYKFIERPNWKHLGGMYLGAFLAVMANFVYLNYFAVLSGALGLILLKQVFEKKNTLNLASFKWLCIPIFTAIVLGILLYKPIEFLKAKNEFQYGAATLLGMFKSVLRNGTFGNKAIPNYSHTFWAWVLIIFLSVIILNGLKYYFRKKWNTIECFQFAIGNLFSLWILAMFVQHLLFDAQYLVDRKVIPFYPLIGLLGFNGLVVLYFKRPKLAQKLSILVAFLFVVHFFKAANFTSSKEWYYDESTKDMIYYLNEKYPNFESKTLATYVIFRTASKFHRRQLDPKGEIIPLSKEEIKNPFNADFLYIERVQSDSVPANYILEKEFPSRNLLFRRGK